MMSSLWPQNSYATTLPRVESAITTKRKTLEELLPPSDNADATRSQIRTYSKRVKVNATLPPAKRQRIDPEVNKERSTERPKTKRHSIKSFFKPLSTASSPNICHRLQDSLDSVEADLTPPSSPPPCIPASPYPTKSRKRPPRRLTTKVLQPPMPTMSFEPGPSSGAENKVPSTSSNEGSAVSANTASVSTSSAPHSALVATSSGRSRGNNGQMIFDSSLGLTTTVECSECKMQYNRTIDTDVFLHEKYHKDYFNLKAAKSSEAQKRVIWKHPLDADQKIICIDRSCSNSLKDFASTVFKQTQEDIGGGYFSRENISIEIPNPSDPTSDRPVPRYKVYVYLKKDVAVAVLLAERIAEAGPYYEGDATHDLAGPWSLCTELPEGEREQAYANKDETRKALMLVDRIWTKDGHRGQGFATQLIDQARDCCFIPGYPIPRAEIAFSWPTARGKEFATGYQKSCFDWWVPFLVGFELAPFLLENDKLVETKRLPHSWAPIGWFSALNNEVYQQATGESKS